MNLSLELSMHMYAEFQSVAELMWQIATASRPRSKYLIQSGMPPSHLLQAFKQKSWPTYFVYKLLILCISIGCWSINIAQCCIDTVYSHVPKVQLPRPPLLVSEKDMNDRGRMYEQQTKDKWMMGKGWVKDKWTKEELVNGIQGIDE